MSNRAKASGAVGTVVDGRVRDLQEHRELEYPVNHPLSNGVSITENGSPHFLSPFMFGDVSQTDH